MTQQTARTVQLSIFLPTYRSDMMAISRIAQACSWASSQIEVIVRDNSGDSNKRDLIGRFQRDNCTIIRAEPCDGPTNFAEGLRLATGEFLYAIADDDLYFDRAITALPAMVDAHGKDPSVAGMTGAYSMEASAGSSLVEYQNIDSDDVTARVAGYLSSRAGNVLIYSPHRRAMVQRSFEFMRSLPAYFSFHDQVLSLVYLLNGRYIAMPRIIYGYDIGPWEVPLQAQKQDLGFYTAAGLDPAINKLHWFLCGFEGAVLARNSDLFPDPGPGRRQAIADQWFAVMFARFLQSPRYTAESPYTAPAEALCQKLGASQGRLSFEGMLADIAGLMEVFAPDLARRYFQFWSAAMNRRQPAAASA